MEGGGALNTKVKGAEKLQAYNDFQMKYRELNPFVKGQGIKVQAAAKRYWDNELDSGDREKLCKYMSKSKKRPPGLLGFGFTKKRRKKTSAVTSSIVTSSSPPFTGSNGSASNSIPRDASANKRTIPPALSTDKSTTAEPNSVVAEVFSFVTYISTFMDSVGGNGRALISNQSIANHEALSILHSAGKCYDLVNPLLSTYYNGSKRQRERDNSLQNDRNMQMIL